MSNIATLQSPEYLAFIRKMVEDPDDDTVRLVCADWLEERGFEDRAKYIRYSLCREHHSKWTDGKAEYHESENEWEDEAKVWPRMSWPDSVYHITKGGFRQREFFWRRGFVKSITCDLAQWMKWGAELCRLHPVEELILRENSVPQYLVGVSTFIAYPGLSESRYFYRATPAAIHFTGIPDLDEISYPTREEALSAISREVLLATRRAIGIETPVVAS